MKKGELKFPVIYLYFQRHLESTVNNGGFVSQKEATKYLLRSHRISKHILHITLRDMVKMGLLKETKIGYIPMYKIINNEGNEIVEDVSALNKLIGLF